MIATSTGGNTQVVAVGGWGCLERRSKGKPGGEKTEEVVHELARVKRARKVMDEICRAAHQTDEESKEKRLKNK